LVHLKDLLDQDHHQKRNKMAKYFKPHKKTMRNPPNAKIDISAAWGMISPFSGKVCEYDNKYNIFRFTAIVEDKVTEDEKHHVLEMSREEARDVVEKLQKLLDTTKIE